MVGAFSRADDPQPAAATIALSPLTLRLQLSASAAGILPLVLPLLPVHRGLLGRSARLPLRFLSTAGLALVVGRAVTTIRTSPFLARARVASHDAYIA